MSKVVQLRVITIQAGELDRFIVAWKTSILPLRNQHGFHTEAAWTVAEENRFYWVLSYTGARSWEEMDEEIYQELINQHLNLDAFQHIDRVERWFIQPLALEKGDTDLVFSPG
jgi:hypothetical protein